METVDYSLDALLQHCDDSKKSGKLSESKANGWKTACRSLILPLAPDLQTDVRKVDVESAVNSYKGNKPDTPKKTLSEYSGRLKNALASFIEPEGTQMEIPSETEPASALERNERGSTMASEIPLAKPKTTSSHTLNIPLRPDFVAQLLIPYDIKPVEAKRIFRMLEVLAMGNEELGS